LLLPELITSTFLKITTLNWFLLKNPIFVKINPSKLSKAKELGAEKSDIKPLFISDAKAAKKWLPKV
jgi:hypothetical protein